LELTVDVPEFLRVALPAVGVSATAAAWLTKVLVSHWLEKDVERQKSELAKQLEHHKVHWEAEIKRQVETYLADKAADREYALDARKRLYTAIGPLRYQLLLACRDLSGRVSTHGRNTYDTDIDNYYGRSTLFRILRPFAISELIERQIAFADFAVDAGAQDLLRFKKAAFAAFTGSSLVEGYPSINWDYETQHVFFDHLSRAANALIVEDAKGNFRCMRFDEFSVLLTDAQRRSALDPFPNLMLNFRPHVKPLLWLRLVGYASLCTTFINKTGVAIGFEPRDFPCGRLLAEAKDTHISANLNKFVARCEALPGSPL
jgi:hypothetical protein